MIIPIKNSNAFLFDYIKFSDKGDEALIIDTSASPLSPLYFLKNAKNKGNISIIFPFFILVILQKKPRR